MKLVSGTSYTVSSLRAKSSEVYRTLRFPSASLVNSPPSLRSCTVKVELINGPSRSTSHCGGSVSRRQPVSNRTAMRPAEATRVDIPSFSDGQGTSARTILMWGIECRD